MRNLPPSVGPIIRIVAAWPFGIPRKQRVPVQDLLYLSGGDPMLEIFPFIPIIDDELENLEGHTTNPLQSMYTWYTL